MVVALETTADRETNYSYLWARRLHCVSPNFMLGKPHLHDFPSFGIVTICA